MSSGASRAHVVILGASSGIGAASALRFSKECNVTCISRSGSLPEGLLESSVLCLCCDATRPEDLKASLTEAVKKFGKISLMIVSAGMQIIKPVRNINKNEVSGLLAANIGIPFFAANIFASQHFSFPNSVLCLISSNSAQSPEPGIVLYGATKGAIESLVVGLAKELSPRRVVGVSPGWLDTPMTQAYAHVYTEKFLQKLKEESPLGLPLVEDVVNAIEFLASDKAKKITGEILIVDGGASL